MNLSYLIYLGLFLAGLSIRNWYESLKKSGKVNSNNKVAFIVVFTAMCMMWAGWFEMCRLDPGQVTFPAIIRWIGMGGVVLGFLLAIGSVLQLKGLENIDRLVTNGLFSRVRHPMYAGFILWILGWAVYHGALISLVVGLSGIGSVLYWKKMEEASMEERFGEAYREYRESTWF
jgi:protein-S-isoprenylcysteine O-methyltransferase Ste14